MTKYIIDEDKLKDMLYLIRELKHKLPLVLQNDNNLLTRYNSIMLPCEFTELRQSNLSYDDDGNFVEGHYMENGIETVFF